MRLIVLENKRSINIAIAYFYFYNYRMNFPLKKILSILSLSIFLLTACSKPDFVNQNDNSAQINTNQNGGKDNAPLTKDDVEELGKIIKLPFAPEEVMWREESVNAPNRKKLTAVVRFSAEDAARIAEQAGNNKSAAAIDAETWFPAELVAQSQLSGDESLKGISYPADNFFQPPYNQGKITRINDTNYFVLELSVN